MKYLVLFSLIGLSAQLSGQMPRNGDYSSWDWEDQSQNNWQRMLDAGEADPEGDGDGWANINPPFSPTSERTGDIVDVYATQDYTKAKGWELVWAQFDGIYPYYILYNDHKGTIRTFFYLDGNEVFSNLLASLSFHDTNNPGILASGEEGAWPTDKYLSGDQTGSEDLISVVIPQVDLRTWCSADFPIFLDNNIQNSRYDNKKWVFKFYGTENYNISIQGTSITPSGADGQHTMSGGSVGSGSFSAQHAKFHKQLKSSSDFLQQMKKSTEKINSTSVKFLQHYKQAVEGITSLSGIFTTAVGISSGAGAVLGFFKLVSGSFDDQKSAKPSAIIQYIDLEGTMDIQKSLGGNTLKIPGVNGSTFPPVAWNPYNCPTGYFNMKKTPTMNVVKPYEKYGCLTSGVLYISQIDYVSGYPGKYKKYKMNENLELAVNEIEGMQLIDIHFAIVCKRTGAGNRKYSLTSPFIAQYKHYDIGGSARWHSVPNPIYKELNNDRFIIHKYDEDNDEVIFGTPYIPMNQFKGITFEVPEDTDVKIRVMAKFASSHYEKPVIFQADYKYDINEENPDMNKVFCNNEQTNFLYDDYYEAEPYLSLASGTYNSFYSAQTVELLPDFTGEHNFIAEAADIYPTNGNTVIQTIDYNCVHSQSNGRIAQAREEEPETESELINSLHETISVYPNPTSGFIHVESSLEEPLERIQVYDLHGKLIDDKIVDENRTEFDISSELPGVYMLNMIYTDKVIVRRIVKR